MATCAVFGTITDASDVAIEGVIIQFVLANMPSVNATTGAAIYQKPIECLTTSAGYFVANLTRNTDFVVIINSIGMKEKIHVPDENSVNLFTLTGHYTVNPTPPVVPTSTGNEDNW